MAKTGIHPDYHTIKVVMTDGTEYRIRSDGGVYKAFPWAYISAVGGTVDPSFTAEVLQAQ